MAGICIVAVAPASASAADRLIVGFSSDASVSTQVAELRRSGVDGITASQVRAADIPAIDVATVTVPEGDGAEVRQELLAQPNVEFVEIDRVAHAAWTPNDPRMAQQWALATIGAPAAWDTTRGSGVTIAVVDTGVSYIHPDLTGKVDLGYDYVDNDADPMDEQGHGTHVAGIAAGITDNGTGIAGAAPNARVLAVRVLDQDGAGYYSWIASGITYAADHGAKVINLSLGGNEGSAALDQAVGYAASKGAVVTCASGNDGVANVGYPAHYEGCTSVGSSTTDDQRSSFSNYGTGLDIVAPGSDILSSVRGGSYESWSGTSMATPYASGVAALLFSQGLSRAQVVNTMLTTAKDLGAPGVDTTFGYGRLDAAAAVAAAATLPVPAADTTVPTVTGVEVGPRQLVSTNTRTTAWKQVKVTKWRVVGKSEYRGSYRWQERRNKATVRFINQFHMSRGVVRRRTITQRKVRTVSTSSHSYRTITVTAADNIAVDRVAFAIDGKLVSTDWNTTDGWSLQWACAAGKHTFAGTAFDARDNAGVGQREQTITC